MTTPKMNKRGGVPDGIFYMVALFTVALISVIAFFALDEINKEFQASSNIEPSGKGLTADIHSKYVEIIDSAFIMILVGILLATVVGVWFIKTHPALFWIMIPIFAFIVFLAAIYANVFFNVTDRDGASALFSASSQFTIIPFIMTNYAYFMTGAIILIAIALFAKGKGDTI